VQNALLLVIGGETHGLYVRYSVPLKRSFILWKLVDAIPSDSSCGSFPVLEKIALKPPCINNFYQSGDLLS
jgi:hypothetical protein